MSKIKFHSQVPRKIAAILKKPEKEVKSWRKK
jgi:hypothetical protein